MRQGLEGSSNGWYQHCAKSPVEPVAAHRRPGPLDRQDGRARPVLHRHPHPRHGLLPGAALGGRRGRWGRRAIPLKVGSGAAGRPHESLHYGPAGVAKNICSPRGGSDRHLHAYPVDATARRWAGEAPASAGRYRQPRCWRRPRGRSRIAVVPTPNQVSRHPLAALQRCPHRPPLPALPSTRAAHRVLRTAR